jgi:three-Cys-motif partner protein
MVESNAWGGPWTEIKVKVIRDYLQSYQIALRNTQFHRSYIDALAGDGTWQLQETSFGPLWGLEEEEKITAASIREGSALAAVSVEPAFDRYVFNDLNSDRTETLIPTCAG